MLLARINNKNKQFLLKEKYVRSEIDFNVTQILRFLSFGDKCSRFGNNLRNTKM